MHLQQARLGARFTAAQLLTTVKSELFAGYLEIGGSILSFEAPMLTEEDVTGWVETIGVRRAATRLLAVPLLFQVSRGLHRIAENCG